jgi:hypothetical protein
MRFADWSRSEILEPELVGGREQARQERQCVRELACEIRAESIFTLVELAGHIARILVFRPALDAGSRCWRCYITEVTVRIALRIAGSSQRSIIEKSRTEKLFDQENT